mgnify:CR=1 FL=1
MNSEASQLGEFLSGLSAQDWSGQSACEGWVIGEVVAHLTGGAESWAESINRGITGDDAPPPGQTFSARGDRRSATIAETARLSYQQLGAQLLDEFIAGHDHLAQVLSGAPGFTSCSKRSFQRGGQQQLVKTCFFDSKLPEDE